MRRPASNITGKPTIPVPGRLDLAVLQQIADNVRERLRQLDAETTYLRSIADNGTSAYTITALQAAIESLRRQIALLAQEIASIETGPALAVGVLVGPAGEDGEEGPRGPPGTGAQGAQGPQGPPGMDGEAGGDRPHARRCSRPQGRRYD
jgi:hypothetical protein